MAICDLAVEPETTTDVRVEYYVMSRYNIHGEIRWGSLPKYLGMGPHQTFESALRFARRYHEAHPDDPLRIDVVTTVKTEHHLALDLGAAAAPNP